MNAAVETETSPNEAGLVDPSSTITDITVSEYRALESLLAKMRGADSEEETEDPQTTTITRNVALEVLGFREIHGDLVSTFSRILQNHTGCTSPAEAFIQKLVRLYNLPDRLTPAEIRFELIEFEDDYELMLDAVRNFATINPTVLAEIAQEVTVGKVAA